MRREGLKSCLVWPEQEGKGLVMGAEAGEVGLLMGREAEPGILPRSFLVALV